MSLLIGSNQDDELNGGDGSDLLIAGGGDDTLDGGDGNDLLIAGSGDDTLDGGDGNDLLIAGSGDDTLDGGSGDDALIAGSGDDTLDGGSGSDFVLGGSGDDFFNYTLGENVDSTDYYGGDGGFDTLQLTLTSAELSLIQSELDAYEAFLASGGGKYTFSFGLTASGFEDLTYVTVGNAAPVAVNDLFDANEDAVALGNVLLNDTDAEDGAPAVVSAVNGEATNVGAAIELASGALLMVAKDGSFTYDPNGKFEHLADGDSFEDSFTYQALDSQGSSSNVATARVVVQGANDGPMAENDSNTTNEDTALASDAATNLLANDFDVDLGDTLHVAAVNGVAADVGAEITLASGALLTVNADGSYLYNPNGKFESLAAGESASDSFSYEVSDGTESATADVKITITGVDDAPAAIRVAVVGLDAGINSAVVGQLASDSLAHLDFAATGILIEESTDWSMAFAGYDVVVLGEDGVTVPVEHDNAGLFSALNTFISGGGGVVTTGMFAGYHHEAAGAETVSPVINPAVGGVVAVASGSPISVNPLDAAGDFIAGGIADVGVPGSYAAQGYHEVSVAGADPTAQVLATDSMGRVAIAYDSSAEGRTVYLGSLHMHAMGDAARQNGSTVDQLFERAVAWAAGEGPSAESTLLGSAEDLLSYTVDSTSSALTGDADALI